MADKKRALLFSGGLDSYCAHKRLKFCGIPHDLVHLDCGTQTNETEQQVVNLMEKLSVIPKVMHLKTVNVKIVERSDGYVPLRNLLFVAEPVMQDYEEVLIGAVKGEWSPDKSRKFFKDTSDLFSYIVGKTIRIYSPIDNLTKTELVASCLENKLTISSELYRTTSCYWPDTASTGRCGVCPACVRRWVALINNDLVEAYDTDPLEHAIYWAENARYWDIFKQPLGRWPDIIMNNMELVKAIRKVQRMT